MSTSLLNSQSGSAPVFGAVDVLVVTDQLPFPPRNGITLPIFNHIAGLQKRHSIRVCLLVDDASPPDAEAIAVNAERYGALHLVPLRRLDKARRLRAELMGIEMYQHGWIAAYDRVPPVVLPRRALLVSPMSAVAKWRSLRESLALPTGRATQYVSIAAVNDCTAAEYRYRHLQAGQGWRASGKAWLDRCRAPLIGRIEGRLLADYHHVLLQTPADRRAMHDLALADIAARVVLVPNGVNEAFLTAPPEPGNTIVFVGELSGEYGDVVEWLLTIVWPSVRQRFPASQLLVVGRGASARLNALFAQTTGVIYLPFAPDLGEIYRRALLVWSPVFKGFGLINKTIEAMAAGVPVVGGRAAFNGIDGFVPERHGVISASRRHEDFIDATVRLLDDAALRQRIGAAGRELVRNQFRWESAVARIHELIDAGPPTP